MADGGGSVLFARILEELQISSTSSPAPRSGWTSVRFGPPASRRESPAPLRGARNLEVGGRGGTGWRQRRPPAEGAGNERRSRSRSRAISCTCAKVTPQPYHVGSSGLLRGELH